MLVQHSSVDIYVFVNILNPQDAGDALCRCAMTCASEFASAFAAQYKFLIIINCSTVGQICEF